jgi:hypothetical protein
MECSTNGEKMNPYILSVGRPEEKRPLRRPRRRWEDNNKICLSEIRMMGYYCLDSCGLRY